MENLKTIYVTNSNSADGSDWPFKELDNGSPQTVIVAPFDAVSSSPCGLTPMATAVNNMKAKLTANQSMKVYARLSPNYQGVQCPTVEPLPGSLNSKSSPQDIALFLQKHINGVNTMLKSNNLPLLSGVVCENEDHYGNSSDPVNCSQIQNAMSLLNSGKSDCENVDFIMMGGPAQHLGELYELACSERLKYGAFPCGDDSAKTYCQTAVPGNYTKICENTCKDSIDGWSNFQMDHRVEDTGDGTSYGAQYAKFTKANFGTSLPSNTTDPKWIPVFGGNGADCRIPYAQTKNAVSSFYENLKTEGIDPSSVPAIGFWS